MTLAHLNLLTLNMQIKNTNQIRPYTYSLKFKATGQYYYGVRFKNVRDGRTPSEDFRHVYQTSSHQIHQMIADHGEDAFEWKIRGTFDSIQEALDWEVRMLKRCKVLENQHIWLNKNIAGHIVASEEGRKKISETHTGVPKSEEHRKRLSESNIGKNAGRVQTDEHRRKNSEANSGENNARYGAVVSQETRDRIGDANRGRESKLKGRTVPQSAIDKQKKTKAENPWVPTAEQREKISKRQTGTTRSQETKDRMSASAKISAANRPPMSQATKDAISASSKGKMKKESTVEQRRKTVEDQIANGTHNSSQKYICPHCGKSCSNTPYKRYHGDKCKLKPITKI